MGRIGPHRPPGYRRLVLRDGRPRTRTTPASARPTGGGDTLPEPEIVKAGIDSARMRIELGCDSVGVTLRFRP